MCNIERHPNFPLYATSPPCPPSQDMHPTCNITTHPVSIINYILIFLHYFYIFAAYYIELVADVYCCVHCTTPHHTNEAVVVY